MLDPIAWLGLLQRFPLLTGTGAPLFALMLLWNYRRLLPGRPAV
jgi:hypothetical protein